MGRVGCGTVGRLKPEPGTYRSEVLRKSIRALGKVILLERVILRRLAPASVTNESPVIKAVYNTLREAEHRSTFYFPYGNLPFASQLVPRQIAFQASD